LITKFAPKFRLKVYFISGQAADETLFENLTLPSHINIKHVHWIEPLKQENFAGYCKRLSKQIDTIGDFVLVGVSFGGIVSIELNKILDPKLTIIISSIGSKQELPPFMKLISLLKIYKLVPAGFYKWHSLVLDWLFGTQTKREKSLLRLYTTTATKNYMRWAVDQILSWENEQRPQNLFHIHGTNDKIFPYQKTHADVLIKNGSHLMVHNRAEEISKILADKINSILS
jgi:hypothetical protein